MSDFNYISSNVDEFRKAGLYKRGPFADSVGLAYQDPTYLSFTFMFETENTDPLNQNSSPLFTGEAEAFLAKLKNAGSDLRKYEERLQALKDFKKALIDINKNMPWYWQSLSGLERLQQYNPLEPYWGGTDAKLTIGCLESINLAITGLMSLYRKAVFDEEKWVYLLPANLRRFSMYVYICEIRNIDMSTYTGDTKDPNASVANEDAVNKDITGGNTPELLFKLSFCEFDIASGHKSIADLKADAPEEASQEIIINYERLQQVDGQYLQGIIRKSPDRISERDFNGSVPNVTNSQTRNDATVLDKFGRQFTAAGINDTFGKAKQQATDSLKLLGEAKKNELLGAIGGAINDRIPTPENLIMNAVNRLDQATRISPAQIEQAVLGNIYGARPGDSITDALRTGAVNGLGLGNVYK